MQFWPDAVITLSNIMWNQPPNNRRLCIVPKHCNAVTNLQPWYQWQRLYNRKGTIEGFHSFPLPFDQSKVGLAAFLHSSRYSPMAQQCLRNPIETVVSNYYLQFCGNTYNESSPWRLCRLGARVLMFTECYTELEIQIWMKDEFSMHKRKQSPRDAFPSCLDDYNVCL